jgi:hypothetical protein
MKDSTYAYAAGLMDAEGCFSIYKPKAEGKITSYQARIVLSSVELSLVKWLVETFGGFYTTHRPKKGRVWYQWNINSHKAATTFLSGILPHLRIKKKEAEVLEEFYSLHGQIDPPLRQYLMYTIRNLKNRECVTTDTLDGDVQDKTTHAYIAGIMDGEGCISAAFSKSGKPIYRIRMGNSYLPLVKFFVSLYGGWFSTTPAHDNTKEFYTWEITKQKQREVFLLRVLPYLRTKAEQGRIVLELVRHSKERNRELKKPLCDRIRLLNSPKIQPVLMGDHESAPAEMLTA